MSDDLTRRIEAMIREKLWPVTRERVEADGVIGYRLVQAPLPNTADASHAIASLIADARASARRAALLRLLEDWTEERVTWVAPTEAVMSRAINRLYQGGLVALCLGYATLTPAGLAAARAEKENADGQ